MIELKPPVYAEGRAMLIAGLRRHHGQETAVQTIPVQWDDFREWGAIQGAIGTTTYGVVCGNDPKEQTFEYMAGIEVASFESLPEGLGRMRINPQRYAVFTHNGPVSKLRLTWAAIWNEWLPASGYEAANVPDFEVYDHRFNRSTGSGIIEIWFPIKPEYDQNITKFI